MAGRRISHHAPSSCPLWPRAVAAWAGGDRWRWRRSEAGTVPSATTRPTNQCRAHSRPSPSTWRRTLDSVTETPRLRFSAVCPLVVDRRVCVCPASQSPSRIPKSPCAACPADQEENGAAAHQTENAQQSHHLQDLRRLFDRRHHRYRMPSHVYVFDCAAGFPFWLVCPCRICRLSDLPAPFICVPAGLTRLPQTVHCHWWATEVLHHLLWNPSIPRSTRLIGCSQRG